MSQKNTFRKTHAVIHLDLFYHICLISQVYRYDRGQKTAWFCKMVGKLINNSYESTFLCVWTFVEMFFERTRLASPPST